MIFRSGSTFLRPVGSALPELRPRVRPLQGLPTLSEPSRLRAPLVAIRRGLQTPSSGLLPMRGTHAGMRPHSKSSQNSTLARSEASVRLGGSTRPPKSASCRPAGWVSLASDPVITTHTGRSSHRRRFSWCGRGSPVCSSALPGRSLAPIHKRLWRRSNTRWRKHRSGGGRGQLPRSYGI